MSAEKRKPVRRRRGNFVAYRKFDPSTGRDSLILELDENDDFEPITLQIDYPVPKGGGWQTCVDNLSLKPDRERS